MIQGDQVAVTFYQIVDFYHKCAAILTDFFKEMREKKKKGLIKTKFSSAVIPLTDTYHQTAHFQRNGE